MVVNNMEHSQAKVAIIPLTPDYDELSIHHIKQSQSQVTNGVAEKTTVEVPRLSLDAGAYKLLTFIQEFNRAREILNWTTSPKLFETFEILLQGFHCQTRSKETEVVGTPTVQHFADALVGFKSHLSWTPNTR